MITINGRPYDAEENNQFIQGMVRRGHLMCVAPDQFVWTKKNIIKRLLGMASLYSKWEDKLIFYEEALRLSFKPRSYFKGAYARDLLSSSS